MKLYRIDKKDRVNLEGLGGLYTQGRWNKKGFRVIYASESISLAAWEKFVHTTDYKDLPKDLVVFSINIPDDIEIKDVPDSVLIPGWDIPEPYRTHKEETIVFGTNFLKQNKYLILKVPSAIVKEEYNYLLNPNHPYIKKCKIERKEPFEFDVRISK